MNPKANGLTEYLKLCIESIKKNSHFDHELIFHVNDGSDGTLNFVKEKNIELEIKLLKDFPEWEFLPHDDLNRKTIEIFFDLNLAKRSCNKEQKVLKVPNTDVFRIAKSNLIAKGISRIVCAENLIAL